ncbi:MAG: NTP transferase domain-containing protein, partial [Vicinamibacterales bacterium]
MSVIVRDAVILAAGNGDRFKNGDHHSKLLHPVGGQPLILRTINTAVAAGIRSFCIVV